MKHCCLSETSPFSPFTARQLLLVYMSSKWSELPSLQWNIDNRRKYCFCVKRFVLWWLAREAMYRDCVGRFSRGSGYERGGHLVERAVAYYEHEIPEENANSSHLEKAQLKHYKANQLQTDNLIHPLPRRTSFKARFCRPHLMWISLREKNQQIMPPLPPPPCHHTHTDSSDRATVSKNIANADEQESIRFDFSRVMFIGEV